MTYLELAKDEAAKLGIVLDDEMADYVLWERTPFPCITGEAELRTYLHQEFMTWNTRRLKTSGPTAWDKVNGDGPGEPEPWPPADLTAVFKTLPEEVQKLALGNPETKKP